MSRRDMVERLFVFSVVTMCRRKTLVYLYIVLNLRMGLQ